MLLPSKDYHWAAARDFIHLRPDLVRAAAKVLARVQAEAGGPFNALHPRGTDWAWNNPDKVISIDTIAAKALEVSSLVSVGSVWVRGQSQSPLQCCGMHSGHTGDSKQHEEAPSSWTIILHAQNML